MRHRHDRKIVAAAEAHVPFRHTWHVIECVCGWSSALHKNKESAEAAYAAHKDTRFKKRAA